MFLSVQRADKYSMHLSGFLIRTFSFNLFIRQHQNSPKFVSVWEAEMLPHDTDKLTQKSECLQCMYKNNRKLQIWFSPHLLFPTQTVALREERNCEVVKCVPSLQPLNNRHLKISSLEPPSRGRHRDAEARDMARGCTTC